MNILNLARQEIRKIPFLRNIDCSISQLTGGLTNHTFKVESTAGTFLLRLQAAHSQELSSASPVTVAVQTRAARAGFAPEIVFVDFAQGVVLERFIGGATWITTSLDYVNNIARLAELVRAVHELPLAEQSFDAATFGARYSALIPAESAARLFANHCGDLLAREAPTREFVCSHNDLVAGNIIDDGRLWLLDWEFACNNHPLFDVACIICTYDLEEDRQRLLLAEFLQRKPETADEQQLLIQTRLFDAIQWLWYAALQQRRPTEYCATRMTVIQRRLLTICS